MTTKNKIALVTGGSRGLGKDMAINLAKNGTDVIITYNSKKDEALRVVADIEKIGRKASAVQLNAGDIASLPKFISEVKSSLKKTFDAETFDFLVNNAGIGIHASFADTTEEQFDALMN